MRKIELFYFLKSEASDLGQALTELRTQVIICTDQHPDYDMDMGGYTVVPGMKPLPQKISAIQQPGKKQEYMTWFQVVIMVRFYSRNHSMLMPT